MGEPTDIDHVEHSRPDAEAHSPKEDYAGEEVQKGAAMLQDPAWIDAQKRYVRKLDTIILPAITLLYFFEYLDRGNVAVRRANARFL